MRLFSNRSQMTSKCGKNKKSDTGRDSRVCHLLRAAGLIVKYNEETKYHRKSFFISKRYFNITLKPAFAHLINTKKPFDVIYCLYKMKQSHWLLCVVTNCDWSRIIASLSRLNGAVALYGMKAELYCTIYKFCHFISSGSSASRKA